MLSTHSIASSAWSRVLKRSSPIAPITVRCSPRLDVRPEPERLDAPTHVLDVRVPDPRLQYDDHLDSLPAVRTRRVPEKAKGATGGGSVRPWPLCCSVRATAWGRRADGS